MGLTQKKKIKSRHHAMRQRLNMRLRGLNDIKYVLRAVASTVWQGLDPYPIELIDRTIASGRE